MSHIPVYPTGSAREFLSSPKSCQNLLSWDRVDVVGGIQRPGRLEVSAREDVAFLFTHVSQLWFVLRVAVLLILDYHTLGQRQVLSHWATQRSQGFLFK